MLSVFLGKDFVRAVKGEFKRGKLRIERFYRSLKEIPKKEGLILTLDFPYSLHRMVHLVPTTKRAAKRLVELELRKVEGLPQNYVFSFRRLREVTVEGRKRVETFVALADGEVFQRLLSKEAWLKRVLKALYTVELSIMGLVSMAGGGRRIVVAAIPRNVFVVVTDGVRIEFSRRIEIPEEMPTDAISGYVNETLLYIPRVIGEPVEKIFLLGDLDLSQLPYSVEEFTLQGFGDELKEFFIPIGALGCSRELSLLPQELKRSILLGSIYDYYVRFILFAVLGLTALNAGLFLKIKEIKKEEASLKAAIQKNLPLFKKFKSLERELQAKRNDINLLSASRRSLGAMNDLGFVVESEVKGIFLKRVYVDSGGKLFVEGLFTCPQRKRYGVMQSFLSLVASRFKLKALYLDKDTFRLEASL